METTDIYQVDGRQPPVNMVFLEITLDKNWSLFFLFFARAGGVKLELQKEDRV